MAEVDSAPGAAGMMPPGAEDSTELLSAGGLTSGEEGTDEGSAAIKPKNLAEVLAAVKKQVEFYFSDANLPTDKHLLKQIQKDAEGFVPLRMIANFKRVKALTKDLAVVAEALKGSTLLSLDEEGSRVRRAAPLPTFDVSDITRRTVVVEHLPDKPTIESVTQLLSLYGDVVMVRICSRGNTSKLPAWLAKAVDAINMTMAAGEFALVEFGSEEDCVTCVNKTRNPDNWRTSLRVRHLLSNFKPSAKAGSRPNSRSSLDHGSRQEAEAHAAAHHAKGQQQHHGRDRESSQTGDGRRNASGKRSSHDGKRASHDGQQHGQQQQQQQHKEEHHGAAAAAATAAGGLPVHLSPIRTHAGPANEAAGQRHASPCANGATRLNNLGSQSPALSPVKAQSSSGVGGAIGSPRTVRSPAPPEVTSFIDSILSAPTASTPTRDGRSSSGGAQEGRWGSSGGDWGSAGNITPAAAVAAALAGVSTPPQSGSPRHSVPGSTGRTSQPGGAAAPGTPTRLSASSSNAAAGAIHAGSLTATQGALAAQLAAAAAAAAQAAMVGSPRAAQGSNAASWRSNSGAAGVSVSAPNTPLAGMSAGDAVAEALDLLGFGSGSGSSSRPIPVGSPDLCGSPKPGPWIPASRLHHMQQAAAHDSASALRSSGSEAEDNAGSWRSSGQGSLPGGSGLRPPKPRVSGSGSASQDGGRQRRRSWHATEGEADTAAVLAGGSSSMADGTNSDGGGAAGRGSSSGSGSRRTSRLAQPSGDYRSTVEAIKEGSGELDAAAAASATAALSAGALPAGAGSSRPGQQRRSSHTGEEQEHDDEHDDGEGEHEHEHGKRRRRRRRSTGSRRHSLDEPHPAGASGTGGGGSSSRRQSLDDGQGGAAAGGRASRRQSLDESGCPRPNSSRQHCRAGALSPDDAQGHSSKVQAAQQGASHGASRPNSHHGSPNPASHMAAAGDHARSNHDSNGDKKDAKKKEKKDYASWAAATPEFRAAASAAKHSGNNSSNSAGSSGSAAGALSSSPARAGLSPLRASGGGATTGHDGDSHVRIARMPDGTRGFGMGRGKPLTPPAP